MKFRPILLLVMLLLLAVPACALEVTVDPTTQFCFSADDFTAAEADEGIFITAVPSSNIADVYYGDRILKAGDALSVDALDSLTLKTACVTQQEAALEYCTISEGKVTGIKALKMSIKPKKNDPPVADNAHLETYKNIANDGRLKASDPEGSSLIYQLETKPRRGTVELQEDGSFIYTPAENKVGKDSFTFVVIDDAGNVSEPAKVSIEIKKPKDAATYADLTDDDGLFEAMWLKDEGIFSGITVGDHLCFCPDESLTRGEFLVMAMKLVDADCELTAATSGFADEDSSPAWMQPYITTALSNGMIAGTDGEDGVVFRPTAVLTQAETAVMLQNILDLPNNGATAVFGEQQELAVPTWAQEAYCALAQAEITFDLDSGDEPLTRRDAARVLYQVDTLMEEEDAVSFYWAK